MKAVKEAPTVSSFKTCKPLGSMTTLPSASSVGYFGHVSYSTWPTRCCFRPLSKPSCKNTTLQKQTDLKLVTFSFSNSIPEDYWVPILSPGNGLLSQKKTCPMACLTHGEECMGYHVHSENATCTMGKVEPTWINNYIPEYILDKKRVFLRAELFERKAVTGVTHVVSVKRLSNDDQPFENST